MCDPDILKMLPTKLEKTCSLSYILELNKVRNIEHPCDRKAKQKRFLTH